MAKKKAKKVAKKAKKKTAKKATPAKKAAKKATPKKKAAKKVAAKKTAKKAKVQAKKKKVVKKKVAKKAAAKKVTAKKPVAPAKAKAAKKTVKKAVSPKKESKKATKAKAEKVEEIQSQEEDWDEIEIEAEEEVILTDAEGRRYCRVRECDQIAVVDGHCRYHYLFFWKRIQTRKKILADGKLERYVVELTLRYPDKYIDMICRDFRTEKDFMMAIQELEIDEVEDESNFENEAQSFIEEVRGMTSEGARHDDDDY